MFGIFRWRAVDLSQNKIPGSKNTLEAIFWPVVDPGTRYGLQIGVT